MNNQIFKKNYIFLDVDLKDQKSVFEFISEKALALDLITNKEALIKGFEHRESESSTGFEDGFAIPHARIKEVKKPAVFVVRFAESLDWKSMDGKPTKVAVALLVPDNPSGDEHLAILSEVAVKLMNETFKNELLTTNSKSKILEHLLSKNKTLQEENGVNNPQLNILALTACVTGVAHTYMAEEKLLKIGKKMGYNIRVETHGSKGVCTPFTEQEINMANLVIFATDFALDNSRFIGKKIYQTTVAKAIKSPEETINSAISKGELLDGKLESFDNKNGKKNAANKGGVLQHILVGISYMIPVIVLGGICLAFSLGIAKAIWGPGAGTKGPNDSIPWGPLAVLEIIGASAFALMIPILAGFIANSIAGRAAIAPAMLGAFIGNDASKFMPMPGIAAVQTPTGFVGAIIAGLLVGYYVRWVNTWRIPKSLTSIMPIFFIPLSAGIGISIIFIYVIGGPIGFVMDNIGTAIKNAYSGKVGVGVGLGLGMILGAMAGFDMGGPINKIAFVTSSVLIGQGILQPMGAMSAAIPVAPLGMGLTTLLFKRFFNQDEQNMGVAAIIMGTIGISEGAIPFAIRDPRRAIPCNVLGSLLAGGIAGAFGVTDAAAHGGPIVAILGAIPYGIMTLYFFISVIAGVTVTTLTYGLWMTLEMGKENSVREEHVNIIFDLRNTQKEKLVAINDEIKKLKQEIKTNKNNSSKQIKQIEKLKNEKANIKIKFNSQISKLKNILKDIEKEEKIYFLKNKSTILNDKSKIKNKYKAIKTKTAKEEMMNKIQEIDIKHHEKFINNYNNRIEKENILA